MSLALLPALPTAAAATAGPAAVATAAAIPGAAGLADLAAVLQCGAGVRPLQAVVLQQLGLKGGQVVLAALDLGSQQHDVGAVTCFLEGRKRDFYFLREVNAGGVLCTALICSAHLKVQILVPLAVLLHLATFDLAVRRVGAQLGQFSGERFEASFVGFDLVLLQSRHHHIHHWNTANLALSLSKDLL